MSSKLLKLSQANLESSTNYRKLVESLMISMIIEFKENFLLFIIIIIIPFSILFSKMFFSLSNSFRISRDTPLAWNIPFRISNEISHDASPWTGYPARLFIIRTWDISRRGWKIVRWEWREVIDAKPHDTHWTNLSSFASPFESKIPIHSWIREKQNYAILRAVLFHLTFMKI